MEIYKEIIVDLETGKEKKVKFSESELTDFMAEQDKLNAIALAKEQAIAQKQAARQSALEKLAALGLTEAEIQALAG